VFISGSLSLSVSLALVSSRNSFNKTALLDAFRNVLTEVEGLAFTAIAGLFDGKGGGVLAFRGQVRRNGSEEGLVLAQVVSEVLLDVGVQFAVGVLSGGASLNDSLTSNNSFTDSGIEIVRFVARVGGNGAVVNRGSRSQNSFTGGSVFVVASNLGGSKVGNSSRLNNRLKQEKHQNNYSSCLFSNRQSIYTEFSLQDSKVKSAFGVNSKSAFNSSDKVFRVSGSELVQVFVNGGFSDFSSFVVVDIRSFQVTSFEESQTKTESVASVSVVFSSLVKSSGDLLQQFRAVVVSS